MPSTIPDLWPDDIDVTEVLTPLAIMRYQASQLRQRTKGLLEGEVDTEEVGSTRLAHHFDIIAPALDRYRYVLFTVTHERAMVYPVVISAAWWEDSDPDEDGVEAVTQNDFVNKIASILTMNHVKSVIHSLIAQSNESQASKSA